MELFIEKKTSKKTGKEYIGLFADIGYAVKLISVDTLLIAELSNMSVRDIMTMRVGEIINL